MSPARWFVAPVRHILACAIVLLVCCSGLAEASTPGRVYRVDIRPHQGFTRLALKLDAPPVYALSRLSGNRVRITLRDTEGPLFRKFRRYSDQSIGGLVFSRRGGDLLVTFQAASGAGVRDLTRQGVSVVTLDVGRGVNQSGTVLPVLAGREKIRSGIEKLIRDFDPPLKTEIPFQPTDRNVLKKLFDEAGGQAFMAAEAALYKGRLSEAEEGFAPFTGRSGPVKPLALYRLGETWYKLQKYPQALAAFREAEKLWPDYLNLNPATTFYYGDSIARSGDLPGGRMLLSGLISRLSDKKFAPALLVRLADIQARQGHEHEARAVYRTVSERFSDNKASLMARLRLADGDFFQTSPWNFRSLSDTYQQISRESSDFELREEALFKHLLLVSMYAGAPEALQQVAAFQKRYPRGVYAAVCRTIREVLVSLAFQESAWAKDPAGLVRFVEEHHDYLAGCVELPDFLKKVTRAYDEAGRPIELIKLFDGLLAHPWSAAHAAYLHEEIAENSDLIGDSAMARKVLQSFLRKYPSHPRSRVVLERLGGLQFAGGSYQDARSSLAWLLKKGERAQRPESYYYLGRSLFMLKEYAQAAKAIDLYLASPGSGGEAAARLLPDAYFVAAMSRDAAGDRKGALRLLENGINLAKNARQDEFLYKAGELSLRDGKKQVAKAYFDRIIKHGKDSDWQRLARQAAESL